MVEARLQQAQAQVQLLKEQLQACRHEKAGLEGQVYRLQVELQSARREIAELEAQLQSVQSVRLSKRKLDSAEAGLWGQSGRSAAAAGRLPG